MRPVMTVLAALFAALQNGDAGHIPLDRRLEELPAAVARVEDDGRVLIIELPPQDIPAADGTGETMIRTPVYRVDIPVSGAIHRYRIELVDATGDSLPRHVLHHVNLNDPSRRELFAPIMLHILAASKETPVPSVPWLLFGMPISEGDRYILSGMLANDGITPLTGVTVRIVLDLVRPGRPWPVWDAYPWGMDVKFPVGAEGGSKAFDLPPGHSSHSWESAPAVAGTLLGLGGHVHDHAVRVAFTNATTGEVLWEAVPERDAEGRVTHVPLRRFYSMLRLGKRIEPAHRYRVTVEYLNPTADTLRGAGMGAVGGLFVPDGPWPRVDETDPSYLADLDNTLKHFGAGMGMGPMKHHH
jgi:hypothetical protein